MKSEQKQEVKQAVLEYIKKRSGVTYVEIEKVFDRMGFDWRGDTGMVCHHGKNILFWDGWTQEAFDILNELEKEKKIFKQSTLNIVYLADGKAFNLPIATDIKRYKELHWLPVVFNVWGEEQC